MKTFEEDVTNPIASRRLRVSKANTLEDGVIFVITGGGRHDFICSKDRAREIAKAILEMTE